MAQNITVASILTVLFVILSVSVTGDPVEDKKALLAFIARVPHSRRLNWFPNTVVCRRWTGITCNGDNSRVVAVRLPGIGLTGPIPRNTLGRLSGLRILSLRLNKLTSPFPSDFANLANLTELHLESNAFSGPISAGFSKLKSLRILNLSSNKFNGSIPGSISNLTRLAFLNLANNSFSGPIPDLNLPNLKFLNISYNHLNGTVPESLSRFPNSSFLGNNLTTPSLSAPSPSPALLTFSLTPSASPAPTYPSVVPSSRTVRRFSKFATIRIAVGGCVVLLVVLALSVYIFYSKKKDDIFVEEKEAKGDKFSRKTIADKSGENNTLVFFEGCNYYFDLEDLLTASAEVLGKGTFGSAYKAAIEDAATVVVKRLKEVAVGKKEFEQQMEVIGKIKHENVAELRAYYYSKDEKLMVYDYFSQGSVCSLLHGSKEDDRAPLDWETRMNIALGAARGIAHIHAENNGKLVHGNIKSSNVFVNNQQYGVVSDLGLTSLMNPMVSPLSKTAGYRAPEVVDTRKASQASDVYSFGVFVLELLTGKSPIQILWGSDEVIHLVRWVQSVVREEWTAEVFDVELMKYPNVEDMVEMLQIAISCVARMPEKRPKMAEVVRMIESVGSSDSENRPSTEVISEVSIQTPV